MSSARSFMMNGCLLALALGAFTACSGPLPRPLPHPRDEANRLNERGLEALRRGERQMASAAFEAAYRQYASIEYFPGMVTALLNRARAGTDPDAAQVALTHASALTRHTPSLESEVCFEQARLLLRRGKASEALALAERALAITGDDGRCRMLNLTAEIRLRLAEFQRAEALAGEALTLATRDDNQRERANALRLQAECALSQKNLFSATRRFHEALEIDKELALSARIAEDLRGLARTAEQAGQPDSALDFWRRAADVSLAGGDRNSALTCLERLAGLYEQNGNTAAAARVRAETAAIAGTQRGSR